MDGLFRRSAETERRYRICALHGYSNALVVSTFSLDYAELLARELGNGKPHVSHRTPLAPQASVSRNVIVQMLLKGFRALGMGAPLLLLEDAMAVAKQLVNQQFSPQMRKWATCVRAGWSVLSAILHQGADWSSK